MTEIRFHGPRAGRRALLGGVVRLAALGALSAAGAAALAGCTPPRAAIGTVGTLAETPVPSPISPEPTFSPTVSPSPTTAPERAPTATLAPRAPIGVASIRFATNHAAVELPWFHKVLIGFSSVEPDVKVEHWNVATRYLEQLATWASAGTIPDVLFARSQHAAAWAYRKWLVDLDDLVARDKDEVRPDDFHSAQVPELKYQGRWLLLPHDYSVPVLYYRADWLAEANLGRPASGWTRGDALGLARKLIKREGDQTTRWGLGWRPDAATLPGLWQGEGGSFIREDGPGVKIDTPENARVTQWLADLAGSAGVSPKVSETPAVDVFASGRLAMEVSGSWAVAAYRGALGSKSVADIAVLPRGASGHSPALSTGSGWALGRDSKAREAAWALMKHFGSRDSIETLVSLPLRNLPGRRSAVPLWLEGLRALEFPTHPEVFTQTAEETYSLRPVPWWLDYQDAFAELMPLVWSGRKSATEVLPDLERRVNQAAARFR